MTPQSERPAGGVAGLPIRLALGEVRRSEDTPNGRAPQISGVAAALKLASVGLHVFSTAAADPKRPITAHGCRDATNDVDAIKRLWRACRGANVAVATGRASGVFVLDVDVKPPVDGRATLRALVARNGDLPITWTTATPSGGLHLFFCQPEGLTLRNRVGFLPGLDIRTDGGAVVVPPSRRPDGRAYSWVRSPWHCSLAYAPDWLTNLINPPRVIRPPAPPVRFASFDRAARYAAAVINGECGEIAATKSGGRNHRLFVGAARIGELVGGGLVPGDLAERELEAAADACGLVADDGRHAVLASIRSGLTRGAANPREVRL